MGRKPLLPAWLLLPQKTTLPPENWFSTGVTLPTEGRLAISGGTFRWSDGWREVSPAIQWREAGALWEVQWCTDSPRQRAVGPSTPVPPGTRDLLWAHRPGALTSSWPPHQAGSQDPHLANWDSPCPQDFCQRYWGTCSLSLSEIKTLRPTETWAQPTENEDRERQAELRGREFWRLGWNQALPLFLLSFGAIWAYKLQFCKGISFWTFSYASLRFPWFASKSLGFCRSEWDWYKNTLNTC